MSWNLVLVIGLALMVVGAVLAVRQHTWIKHAQVAPGTIIEMRVSRGSKGGRNFDPRVQFTALDGSKHEFMRGYASSPPDFAVGDRIMVAYDPSSYEGRILTFGQRFGFPAILLIFGLSLALMGGTFFVGRRMVPGIYTQQVAGPADWR